MLFSNGKIKSLCKSIIKNYTFHVRDEISKGRLEYKESGIDNDISIYRSLFLELLALSLGVAEFDSHINIVVKEESVSLIKRDLSSRRYRSIVKTNRCLIYKTCELIFDTVVLDLFGGVSLEVK